MNEQVQQINQFINAIYEGFVPFLAAMAAIGPQLTGFFRVLLDLPARERQSLERS